MSIDLKREIVDLLSSSEEEDDVKPELQALRKEEVKREQEMEVVKHINEYTVENLHVFVEEQKRRNKKEKEREQKPEPDPSKVKKVFVCEICNYSFKRKWHLKRHTDNVHKEIDQMENETSENSHSNSIDEEDNDDKESSDISVPIPNKKAQSTSKGDKSTEEFVCLRCDKNFRDSIRLKRHFDMHYRMDKMEDEKDVDVPKNNPNGKQKVPGGYYYACHLCEKKYRQQRDLNYHLEAHVKKEEEKQKTRLEIECLKVGIIPPRLKLPKKTFTKPQKDVLPLKTLKDKIEGTPEIEIYDEDIDTDEPIPKINPNDFSMQNLDVLSEFYKRKQYDRMKRWRDRNKIDEPMPYYCSKCSKIFNSKYYFINHNKKFHPNETPEEQPIENGDLKLVNLEQVCHVELPMDANFEQEEVDMGLEMLEKSIESQLGPKVSKNNLNEFSLENLDALANVKKRKKADYENNRRRNKKLSKNSEEKIGNLEDLSKKKIKTEVENSVVIENEKFGSEVVTDNLNEFSLENLDALADVKRRKVLDYKKNWRLKKKFSKSSQEVEDIVVKVNLDHVLQMPIIKLEKEDMNTEDEFQFTAEENNYSEQVEVKVDPLDLLDVTVKSEEPDVIVKSEMKDEGHEFELEDVDIMEEVQCDAIVGLEF